MSARPTPCPHDPPDRPASSRAVLVPGWARALIRAHPRMSLPVVAATLLAAVAVAVTSAVTTSCGAAGIDAPRVPGAREDLGCPSAEEALAQTRATLGVPDGDSALDELRPTLERVLVDDGGVRVLLAAALTVLREASTEAVRGVIERLVPGDGLGALTVHVVNLLRYLDGSSAWSAEPRLEPVAAVHELLTRCDAAPAALSLRRLLELEVAAGPDGLALVGPGAGDEVWLKLVLEQTRAALGEPELRTLLEAIELEDPDAPPGMGRIRVGRDAFLILSRLIVTNIAAPDFDPGYVRGLVDDVLVGRVQDEAARARLDALLDVVFLVTDPGADVFPHVQSLMGCLDDSDPQAALPGLIFDWLTVEELSMSVFLDDVLSSTSGEVAGALRRAALEVLRVAADHPDMTADVARVLASFLDAPTAPVLVRTALRVQGRGVVSELMAFLDTIQACRDATAGP